MRKIIGYGICGPGEADRYMRDTMEEFKRLCDKVVILVNDHDNRGTMKEKALIYEYGFRMVQDHREWGTSQHKIKQDFLDKEVRKYANDGDIMLALDMDERFDRYLTRDWLMRMPFDAYHTFVVDLWNDEKHYKPQSCFWKVQIWRWNGVVEWKQKPLHCGLAPLWAASYNKYAPFLMIHRGLMDPEDRARKIRRYQKYDPHARYLAKPYYAMLHSDTAEPFDEERMHDRIENEVAGYRQTKPRTTTAMQKPKENFFYVKNPGGMVVDIPERALAETLRRPGFELVGSADDAEAEMDELFGDGEDILDDVSPAAPGSRAGSYQRSTADEARELARRNGADDDEMFGPSEPAPAPRKTTANKTRSRLGFKEAEKLRVKAKAKAAAKKKVVKKRAPAKKK